MDASTPGTAGRTVTSIDGSTSTPYPNFASWFNATEQIRALDYLTIGAAPGLLAHSGDVSKFQGEIAFVAFVPLTLTQAEAALATRAPDDTVHVFHRGDATGSGFFRIPFLLNTAEGSLIAGSDANFGSTGDSAENIDAALRRKAKAASHGAAQGWSEPVIPSALHMRDYADEIGYRQSSASVIDGAIAQDALHSKRIIVLIDLFPWNGGVFEHLNIMPDGQARGGRNRNVAPGDGFATIAGKKYLLLSSQNLKGSADGKTDNINNNTDRARFDYVADVAGPTNEAGHYAVYRLNGTPRPYHRDGSHVDDSNLSLGEKTVFTLDREFVVHKDGVRLDVTQRSSSGPRGKVPMKVFYEDSILQVYNTAYIMQVVSDDDGQTWQADQLISSMVKREDSSYYILGPGKAIQLQEGEHRGRIVVPVYYDTPVRGGNGSPLTEVIFSDDAGKTWQHGAPIPTSLGLHEAALVELPGGAIQAFVRNTSNSGGRVVSATSTDGGSTWRDVASAFGDSSAGINSQVSALTLSQKLTSPSTGELRPAIVVATAMARLRTNGVAHVGLMHNNGEHFDGSPRYRIEWVKQHQLTGASQLFAYSSMDQLYDGRVAILYESSPTTSWAEGLQQMYYKELTPTDLLP